MTRKEANLKILSILISHPDLILLAGCSMPEDLFVEEYPHLIEDVEAHPQLRFIQLLWAIGWNASGEDRFYEESTETLQKLLARLDN